MQRSADQHQRGSISVLSVLWCAFTLTGVMLISHATDVVQQRAFAQESADFIALAAVIGGQQSADTLEGILNVTISQLELSEDGAVVKVKVGLFTATSSATRFS